MKKIIKNYLEISKRIEKIENLLLDAIDAINDKHSRRKINFALCDLYSLKKDVKAYQEETYCRFYWKIWELKNNGNEKETN